ncbi:hypothetical protein WL1483_4272 [Aeromonas schubertii]|uniref:Uncharacterized protein n=1 Tax=Aeromonas schubertii TaxID=652 RepID=A0A0S2SPP9_9GAMM|nr:hypothetical protein WL1483_4272 [Aeromonas schubertii]
MHYCCFYPLYQYLPPLWLESVQGEREKVVRDFLFQYVLKRVNLSAWARAMTLLRGEARGSGEECGALVAYLFRM